MSFHRNFLRPGGQLILTSLSHSALGQIEGSRGSYVLPFLCNPLPALSFPLCPLELLPIPNKLIYILPPYNKIFLPPPGFKQKPAFPLGSYSFYCHFGWRLLTCLTLMEKPLLLGQYFSTIYFSTPAAYCHLLSF